MAGHRRPREIIALRRKYLNVQRFLEEALKKLEEFEVAVKEQEMGDFGPNDKSEMAQLRKSAYKSMEALKPRIEVALRVEARRARRGRGDELAASRLPLRDGDPGNRAGAERERGDVRRI
jgi:hypothetical protein